MFMMKDEQISIPEHINNKIKIFERELISKMRKIF